ASRPNTYRSYERLVRGHIAPALGKHSLERLSPKHVQTFLNQKAAAGLSPRTVHHLHAVTRNALGRAHKWQLVPRNVAELVDAPTVESGEIEAMSAERAKAILQAFKGNRLEGLVTLTLALGLRQGEALGLRWVDVDLDARALSVRHQVQRTADGWSFVPLKTKRSRRTLPLPSFVVDALGAHRTRQLEDRLGAGARRQDFNLVFPTRVGTPFDGVTVTHRFQARLAAAGLPHMRFHDLRHGAATLLKAMGADL